MTVDELVAKYKIIPASPLAADLQALVLTVAKCCADVIDEEAIAAHQSGDTDTIFRLRNCRDKILATSPGKGGG